MKKLLLVISTFALLSGCTTNTGNKEEKKGYTHEMGVTVVPDQPKVVSDFYVGELLALDVNVVGAPLTYKSPAWDVEGITEIGDSMEHVAALSPDLILTINKDMYDKYSAIAPTIYLPYGAKNPIDTLIEFGKIFSKEKEANAWINDFNKNVEELKSTLVNTDETYSIMKLWNNDIWLYGNNWGHGGFIIYDKLGLKAPVAVQKDVIENGSGYLSVSLENLNKYTGDVLLAMDFSEGSSIKNSEVFKQLPAVKNEKVIYLNSMDFFHVDPISLNYQLDLFKGILNVSQ